MSGAYPPLTCKDIKHILRSLGFEPRPQKGTSHEHRIRKDSRGFFKVTVDCPKAPFSQDLISSMANQAGLSKKEFYSAYR